MDNKTKHVFSKSDENKQEDKKAFWPFLLIMTASLLVGFFSGYFLLSLKEFLDKGLTTNLLDVIHNAQLSITNYAGYATLIIVILLNLIGFILLFHCRKYDKTQSSRTEDTCEKLEHLLSLILLLTAIEMILSWVLYGIGSYGITFKKLTVTNLVSFFICLCGFILSFICSTILQQKTVNFAKELNPEKQGSVYDMKFQKKWMESCDEAEQYLIYKCSFKAYQAVSTTCTILAVILTLAGMFLPIGFVPLVCVCLIWGIQTIVYVISSMKITSY